MLEEEELYRVDNCRPITRINLERLTCRGRVVDIHGVLLRNPSAITSRSTLVSTPSTAKTLRALTIRLSLCLPILLTNGPLNLSHQTEGSDPLGGFKPVDACVPASDLQRQFLDLFARKFGRRKNSQFEDAVRKAVSESRWKRVVRLWKECARLALDKIKERATEWPSLSPEGQNDPRGDRAFNGDEPRKRRKVDKASRGVDESHWLAFARDVEIFNVQNIHNQGKFAFGFIEGALVQALKNGYLLLLDEINLARPETLECISSILQGPTASIVSAEQGSFVPVQRHPVNYPF
ncbi:hypothetical protein JB92DRAFT_3108594 [Gautieria morchelliformis]|nr:hypothetical protein JB92DRAFT_3108594 [Gautieria morchelliformis]